MGIRLAGRLRAAGSSACPHALRIGEIMSCFTRRACRDFALALSVIAPLASLLIPASVHATPLYAPAGANANLFVAKVNNTTIERYSSTGTDLGTFATGLNAPF